jgi:hypothetical protein
VEKVDIRAYMSLKSAGKGRPYYSKDEFATMPKQTSIAVLRVNPYAPQVAMLRGASSSTGPMPARVTTAL